MTTNQDARSPQGHRAHRRGLLLASLCCLWPILLPGQIFRYQDEHGNWHFTDDPPDRYESSVIPDIATSGKSPRDAEPTDDLEAHLQSVFSPITPIAYATLAVVSIQTDSGEGSGFFCSETGHILTNKHVVRPQPEDGLDDRERRLEDQEQDLRTIEANLKETRDQLRLMKEDLKGYEGLIENARDEKTRNWAHDARARLSQRYQTERDRISGMERSIRTLKPGLRESRLELGYVRRSATADKRFDILLKDGTELVANLVGISDHQDLALLKLDGYRTPFLRLDAAQPLSQGLRVFAIGNPLGMQDAVTSGVVTQITPEHLLTDAQILPGSSGGPLIRESGAVIGINVSRKVAAGTSKYAAGFGKVIPIALALQEFPTLLSASSIEAFDADQAGRPGPDQTGAFDSNWIENAGAGPGADTATDRSGDSGLGGTGSSAMDQDAGFGSDHTDTSTSAPVRLIVPEDNSGAEANKPAQPETRSLDFPPEGSAIPPAISSPAQ